jgi:nitroimidazol reductase NimA-like FMN-containing flavoprotein (pyridoxamine 5'-phosphate oxidase superfamily)
MSCGGLQELTRQECVQLLEGEALGRVAVTIGALPAVLPVNFDLLDDAIVFRTAEGTKLTAALVESVVAFEVDRADAETRSGWSVLVVGRAEEICDEATLRRARDLGLRSWATNIADHFVRIPLDIVTGRRIAATAGDGLGPRRRS